MLSTMIIKKIGVCTGDVVSFNNYAPAANKYKILPTRSNDSIFTECLVLPYYFLGQRIATGAW